MTRQHPTKLFLTVAIVLLISGLMVQAAPQIVNADPPVPSPSISLPSQIANTVPATKCMECHHSELVSRVDQLTTDPSPDLRPSWSPDGTKLAFYSGRNDNDDIWVVDVDGNSEIQLTEDPGRDRRPSWSPDGTKIVFDSNRAGNQDIWIMNADGTDQRQLTTGPGQEMFASFSPDGSQIIFYGYESGRNDIWTIDMDGSNLNSLTSGLADETQSQCTFACHTPAFSPDGKTIAYHADNDGSRNLWVMDADGNNPRQLTTTSTSDEISNYLPSWSPDGRIIFQAERPVALTIRTDIRMINVDGSEEVTLFSEVAHGGPFIWSPDGTQVALHSQQGGAGNFDIFVATLKQATEVEDQPEQEESPVEEESPGDEELPVEEEAPTEEDAPAEGAASSEATTPAEVETLVEAESSTQEETLVEEDAASLEEDPSKEEVAPIANESPSSSIAASEEVVSASPYPTGTVAVIGVSVLLVTLAGAYGLRKFRRN